VINIEVTLEVPSPGTAESSKVLVTLLRIYYAAIVRHTDIERLAH
jgi:hypothetical protein